MLEPCLLQQCFHVAGLCVVCQAIKEQQRISSPEHTHIYVVVLNRDNDKLSFAYTSEDK